MESKTTYANPSPLRLPGDDYARFLNANKAFEGGGLLPPPGGGFQIPPVTQFKVARVEPQVGGAKVSLTWLADDLEVTDRVQIQAWISSDYGLLATNANPKDIDFSTLVTYGAPVIFNDSPGEFFVPATRSIVAVFSAATLHSSGVVTLRQFQPTVAVEINPLGSYLEYRSASFDISPVRSTTYLVNTSAASVVCTLPPVRSTPPGMVVITKKITGDANTLHLVGSGGVETIDGALSFNDPTAYAKFMVTSDHRNNCWWKII